MNTQVIYPAYYFPSNLIYKPQVKQAPLKPKPNVASSVLVPKPRRPNKAVKDYFKTKMQLEKEYIRLRSPHQQISPPKREERISQSPGTKSAMLSPQMSQAKLFQDEPSKKSYLPTIGDIKYTSQESFSPHYRLTTTDLSPTRTMYGSGLQYYAPNLSVRSHINLKNLKSEPSSLHHSQSDLRHVSLMNESPTLKSQAVTSPYGRSNVKLRKAVKFAAK